MPRIYLQMICGVLLAILAAHVQAQPSPTAGAQVGADFDRAIGDAKAMMLIDPLKTVDHARTAERLAERLPGNSRAVGIATAEWLQGEGFLRVNDSAKATPLIERALKIISRAGPSSKLNGDLLLSRGGIRTANADVAGALDDYQKAHNIFQNIGDTRSRAKALLNIALLYQEAEDYNNALKYYDQSLDVYRGDPQILYAIYNNRANALKELGRVAESEAQFRKALVLAKEQKSPIMEARVLSNIARVQLVSGQLAAADRTIVQGFAVARGTDAAGPQNQFLVLSATSAFYKGDLNEAVQMIARSLVGIDPAKTTLEMRETHKIAYDIYRKAHDDPKALIHLEALKRLDDQTSRLAASANTSLSAARFDFANQELRIAKLKADELQRNVDFERAQAQTRQRITVGIAAIVAVVLGLLGAGVVTLRRSRNDVRAANIDLAETNSALGKALAAKTEFLATTSHEIRTPLNGILGMTQVMLADGTLADPVRERISVVHGAGLTMRALVDDILDVAKMETGNLTMEQVPLNLKATLGEVTRLWEEQAKARGVQFRTDLSNSPDWIEGDPARLRQIVFNLLSNALKFTSDGGVTLSATAVAGRLLIQVRDTGIGIPADKHDLIFESFRQVDAGTTRKFGGTGLGLAICRNLARAMGGDVRLDSVEGAGSTFTIDLPLIISEAPEVAAITAKKALLIIDRSPITRSMLRAMIESHADAVQFASNVDEALERLHSGQIEQVLIDDGTINAAADRDAALSAIAAAASDIGVKTSLLWAEGQASDHAVLLATGIDQIIAKPVTAAMLAEKLYVSYKNLVSQAA